MVSQLSIDNPIDRRLVFEILGRKMTEEDEFVMDYKKQGLAFKKRDGDSSDSFDSNEEPFLDNVYDDFDSEITP
jgi:hypothetical protein